MLWNKPYLSKILQSIFSWDVNKNRTSFTSGSLATLLKYFAPFDFSVSTLQRSAKRLVRGCEKFVPALAYLFWLALPGSCLARFASLPDQDFLRNLPVAVLLMSTLERLAKDGGFCSLRRSIYGGRVRVTRRHPRDFGRLIWPERTATHTINPTQICLEMGNPLKCKWIYHMELYSTCRLQCRKI